MENLIISLEATCDLPKDLITKHNFKIVDMDFLIDGEVYSTSKDDVISTSLYEKMKKGIRTSTSQVNDELYYDFFKKYLKEDSIILHLAFSSGLSCTYKSAVSASNKINEELGNKVYVIDSLCACSGQGMLAILVSQFAKKAKNIEEVIKYAETTKMQLNHIFTVDNLKYLANGGRVKGSTAFVGNLLNIKPVMKMDNEGHLVSYGKVLSRKKSLSALFNKFKETILKGEKLCFVSHADSLDDALFIAKLMEDEGYSPIVTDLGPVIGCHSGPGTIALFYLANER